MDRKHHYLETFTCDLLKYKRVIPYFSYQYVWGKSIRIKRVNMQLLVHTDSLLHNSFTKFMIIVFQADLSMAWTLY